MSLEVIIWGVGHGNAILIKTPNNKRCIIDLGVNVNEGIGEYRDFSPIKYMDVNYLHGLVITHPHSDHMKDIKRIDFDNVKHFVRPLKLDYKTLLNEKEKAYKQNKYREEDLENFKKFVKYHKDRRNPHITEYSPLHFKNSGGVQFLFYKPTKCNPLDIDNHSIVTILKYAGHKIILTGDNKKQSWDDLLKRPGFKYDVSGESILLAPHHAREGENDNITHPKLFNYLTPKLTIISSGSTKETSVDYKFRRPESGLEVNFNDEYKEEREIVSTRRDTAIKIDCLKEEEYPKVKLKSKKRTS